jgi:hypothetical protein
MDAKEQWLVERAVATLRGGTFGETDVLALLILLRRVAPKFSPIREFADFIAHRERDRGILLSYIERVRLALEASGDPVKLPVWSCDEVVASLNAALAVFCVPAFEAELGNRICVSIITILQSVHVEAPSSISHLTVGLSSHQVGLFGRGAVPSGHIFQFPLFIAENRGYEYSLTLENCEFFMGGDRIIEALSRSGSFMLEQRREAA